MITMHCRFCDRELEPVQQFVYWVEMQTLQDPQTLSAIRTLPHHHGKPLRICRACQARMNAGQPPVSRPGISTTLVLGVGVLALMWLTQPG